MIFSIPGHRSAAFMAVSCTPSSPALSQTTAGPSALIYVVARDVAGVAAELERISSRHG
jgi:hypothetical protein